MLVHVVDAASVEGRDPLEDIRTIIRELEKYNPKLLERPQVIAANKMDAMYSEEDQNQVLDALKSEFEPGDLMLITDHINFMGANPLIGPNEDMFGCRFPDMTKAYNKELAEKARKCAGELSIDLKEGTYVGYGGPSFETPAEIRMFQMLGAAL